MKRILAVVIALVMIIGLFGCKKKEKPSEPIEQIPAQTKPVSTGEGKRIAIILPESEDYRWILEGVLIESGLKEKGYTVDLYYGDDGVESQKAYLEEAVLNKVDAVILAAIQSSGLADTLAEVKAANIPVIAYDNFITGTNAVDYYITYNPRESGRQMGSYIEKQLGLDTGAGPFGIEFISGSFRDIRGVEIYEGLMEVLDPYLESDQLMCWSGQISHESNATGYWSNKTAHDRFAQIVEAYYGQGGAKELNAVVCALDSFSYEAVTVLEENGYTEDNWPLITGQNGEISAAKNILAGKQSQTIFKDYRLLVEKTVEMTDKLANGTEPEVNDSKTFDNGEKIVPTYLVDVTSVTEDNLAEVMIDSGFYTLNQLEIR